MVGRVHMLGKVHRLGGGHLTNYVNHLACNTPGHTFSNPKTYTELTLNMIPRIDTSYMIPRIYWTSSLVPQSCSIVTRACASLPPSEYSYYYYVCVLCSVLCWISIHSFWVECVCGTYTVGVGVGVCVGVRVCICVCVCVYLVPDIPDFSAGNYLRTCYWTFTELLANYRT